MTEIACAAKVDTSMFVESTDLYLTLDEDETSSVFLSKDICPSLQNYIKNALGKFVLDTSFKPPPPEIYSVISTEDLGCGDKCTTLDQRDGLFARYLNLAENKHPITNWLEWSDCNCLSQIRSIGKTKNAHMIKTTPVASVLSIYQKMCSAWKALQ